MKSGSPVASRREARYRECERALWASIGATPSERFVELARTGLRVRVQEIGAGPPVLFIHGANTSGLSWATLAAKLPSFRCILLDRPGTGLSDPMPGRAGTDRLIELGDTLAVDVLDALGIGRAHLVATSLGGFVALRSAAAHSERFDRMVQFSWPAGAPTCRIPMSMRLTAIPGVASLAAAAPVSESTVRSIFRSVGHGPSVDHGGITDHDIAAYLGLLRFTDTLRNELRLSAAAVSPLRGLSPRLLPPALLHGVRVPTLFIWGENDVFGGPEIARSIVHAVPGARLEVIEGAGHAPWLDDLERCAALTADFLAGDDRRGSTTGGGAPLDAPPRSGVV